MTDELEAIKRKRFEYLLLLYKTTQGSYDTLVHTWELGSEVGLTRDETGRIVDYLRREGLIRTLTFDKVAITHQGVVQIEHALSQPDKPTDYFPPVNIVQVQQMVNSQIQQGTYQSTQTGDFSQTVIATTRQIARHRAVRCPTIACTRLCSARASQSG
jgi:hypothetical protein